MVSLGKNFDESTQINKVVFCLRYFRCHFRKACCLTARRFSSTAMTTTKMMKISLLPVSTTSTSPTTKRRSAATAARAPATARRQTRPIAFTAHSRFGFLNQLLGIDAFYVRKRMYTWQSTHYPTSSFLKKNKLVVGSIAQCLKDLLLRSAAPGSNNGSRVFF